jgi:hypothetical protein
MNRVSMIGVLFLLLVGSATVSAQKLDFSGSWTMDRARSFGLPGNMNQTMTVAQSVDEIQVETKLIQPGNERTQKDTFVLDGKERDFNPPVASNAPANAPPPTGKRTAYWMPGNKGILVDEVTTSQTANGPTVAKTTRKWTLSNGELVIDMYVDNPNISYEAKRVFKKSRA